jgi:hypothetical protein
VRRNQSTSIGAPRSVTCRPAASRIVECRLGADDQIGGNLGRARRVSGRDAGDALARACEAGRFRAHHQAEPRITLALRREEIEEVPLRHHDDAAAARRQVGEIADAKMLVAELALDVGELRVRQGEELVEQAELGQHVGGRRMDRVAAEIAKKVGVLLQHDHVDAGARQQEARHHPGRPAARDHARA